jgi:hypothetical protein
MGKTYMSSFLKEELRELRVELRGTSSYVINSFLVIWILMSWMGLIFLFFTIDKFLGEK